jgi:hypothetical protein
MTSAQFSWAQAAVAVTISGLEELQNAGEEKIIDLMDARIEQRRAHDANNLSSDFYSDGTADGGKQVGGLQALVADTTSGTVGGISRTTWPFWRNNIQSFATAGLTAGAATIQTMMNRTWHGARARRRQAGPDHRRQHLLAVLPGIVAGDPAHLQTDSAMAGFQSLKFMTADVVFDGGFQGVSAGTGSTIDGNGITWTSGTGAPSSHMYFLNTDYLFLRPHRRPGHGAA